MKSYVSHPSSFFSLVRNDKLSLQPVLNPLKGKQWPVFVRKNNSSIREKLYVFRELYFSEFVCALIMCANAKGAERKLARNMLLKPQEKIVGDPINKFIDLNVLCPSVCVIDKFKFPVTRLLANLLLRAHFGKFPGEQTVLANVWRWQTHTCVNSRFA